MLNTTIPLKGDPSLSEADIKTTRDLLTFVVVRRMVRNGAPGVCTAKSDQNPPTSEQLPPVIGCALASGCPMCR